MCGYRTQNTVVSSTFTLYAREQRLTTVSAVIREVSLYPTPKLYARITVPCIIFAITRTFGFEPVSRFDGRGVVVKPFVAPTKRDAPTHSFVLFQVL